MFPTRVHNNLLLRCVNPFKMYMYVPCQERFSLLYIYFCGSQQFPQLFVGDVYGISELIEKSGVEVDTVLKVTGKAFDPSLYCLYLQVSCHNTSLRNRWK